MGFGLRLGFDIGKISDYSALCTAIATGEGSDTIYNITHVERFDLGISYPDQVDMLEERAKKALGLFNLHVEKKQINRHEVLKPSIYVDYTGLGVPVVDLIRKTSIPKLFQIRPCKFVHGDNLTNFDRSYSVGKAHFVTRLLVLSQNKRMRFNAMQRLKNPFIEKEFKDFDIDVDEKSGKSTYGAMRPGTHDDQVCAIGLACLIDNPKSRSWKAPTKAVTGGSNPLLEEANDALGGPFEEEEENRGSWLQINGDGTIRMRF